MRVRTVLSSTVLDLGVNQASNTATFRKEDNSRKVFVNSYQTEAVSNTK